MRELMVIMVVVAGCSSRGPAGPAGATGPAGGEGAMGATGAMGTMGAMGAEGATGPAVTGPMGVSGVRGPTGVQGGAIHATDKNGNHLGFLMAFGILIKSPDVGLPENSILSFGEYLYYDQTNCTGNLYLHAVTSNTAFFGNQALAWNKGDSSHGIYPRQNVPAILDAGAVLGAMQSSRDPDGSCYNGVTFSAVVPAGASVATYDVQAGMPWTLSVQ
jgi:hypothetical protein